MAELFWNRWPNSVGTRKVYYSPDGKTVATVFLGWLDLFDAKTGTHLHHTVFSSEGSGCFAFSSNGAQFALGGESNGGTRLQIWNTSSFKPIRTLSTDVYPVAIQFSPDGSTLANCGISNSKGFIELWNLGSGSVTRSIPISNPNGSFSISYSPNSVFIAIGTVGSTPIQVWNASNGTLASNLTAPNSLTISSVAFSPDGKTVAGCGFTGVGSLSTFAGLVDVWDFTSGALISTLDYSPNFISSGISFSPDGATLAHVGYNSTAGYTNIATLNLWDVSTQTLIGSFNPASPTSVGSVAYSPDGKSVASGFESVTGSVTTFGVGIWNVATGLETRTFKTAANLSLNSVAFSPNGALLVDGGAATGASNSAGVLEAWNLSTGNLVSGFETALTSVAAVAFSPDGSLLAAGGTSANHGGAVELWDVATGSLVSTLQVAHGESLNSIVFSPDGKSLGIAVGPPAIEIWDVATLTLTRTIASTIQSSMTCLAFSPDGSAIGDGGYTDFYTNNLQGQFGVLEQWNPETGLSGGPSSGLSPVVSSVAYSPDGKILFSGGYGLFADSSKLPFALLNDQDFAGSSIAVSPKGTQVAVSGGSLVILKDLLAGAVPIASLTLNTSTVISGQTLVGKVTLAQPAPVNGLQLTLYSANRAVVPPPTVTISGGASSATFTIVTYGVDQTSPVAIQVTDSVSEKSATLTVLPSTLSSVSLGAASIVGGNSLSGLVTLKGVGDVNVGTYVFFSSSFDAAIPPYDILIPTGESSSPFSVTTSGVTSPQTVKITASLGSKTISSALTILPASISQLTLSPTSVSGGSSSTATIKLNGAAGPDGLKVTLSSNSAVASVPSSVTVPAGQNSVTFVIQTLKVSAKRTATIKASAGNASQSATLAIT